MRPTDRPTTAFWRRVEQWIGEEEAGDPIGRKITQTDLARLFNVSTSAISNWKLGHDVPKVNNLHVIAQRTGVPFEDLVRLVQVTVAERSGVRLSAPDSDPGLRAVAAGDEADPKLADEADARAAQARREQQRNIEEMNRKKKGGSQ